MDRPPTLILGVTGSIAAYKAVELASLMTQGGWRVLTIMTTGARDFIQPLSFSAITQQPVLDYEDPPDPSCPLNHVTTAQAGDVLAIVPATANTMAKVAHGLGDNFLTLSVLAFKGPVIIAPAMNCRMYANQAVQDNVQRLKDLGYHMVGPVEGHLACGETGLGRLSPLPDIQAAITGCLKRS